MFDRECFEPEADVAVGCAFARHQRDVRQDVAAQVELGGFKAIAQTIRGFRCT